MNGKYRATIRASFLGYVVQAIVNNFVPLLFIRMQSEFSIPLAQITLLITFNFGLQLLIDLLSTPFVEKIGYRASILLSNACAIAGLVLLTILPGVTGNPFVGILISVCVYAVGGGLQEVLVSPIMENCPTAHKEKAMSLLHSFYCWGSVGVIVLSTLFFSVFGVDSWKWLACVWALIPLYNIYNFATCPIERLTDYFEKIG